MILAGDIGGTKTTVALFRETEYGLLLVRDATVMSCSYSSLEALLIEFLAEKPELALRVACFGVAGPVLEGTCKATNLPWTIEESALLRVLSARRVKLLNDVEAAAYGMLHLPSDAFAVLNPGAQPTRQGNMAVVAAGTGLGEAMLYWDGARHHPIATEGGHADFAPQTEQEIALLRYLRTTLDGHVSCERVLSGPGLHQIYVFLRHESQTPEPAWLTTQLQLGDPSAMISHNGLNGADPVCAAALEVFACAYGREAGNLALKVMAVGGVFIGGGIAPRILPVLRKGGFMRAFTNKGRLRALLESIEVKVALNTRAPLLGAAYCAIELDIS